MAKLSLEWLPPLVTWQNWKKTTLPPTSLRYSQVHATLDLKLNLDMPMVVGFFSFFIWGSWPWVVQWTFKEWIFFWTLFICELKIVGNKLSCIGYCLYMGEKVVTHRLSCVLNFLILDFWPLSLQITIFHSHLLCFWQFNV